jgi:hypothetical protein
VSRHATSATIGTADRWEKLAASMQQHLPQEKITKHICQSVLKNNTVRGHCLRHSGLISLYWIMLERDLSDLADKFGLGALPLN